MNGHHPPTIVVAGIGVIIGAAITEVVGDVLGVVVLITGLTTAVARYAAVLAGWSNRAVERVTAVGFFAGLVISGLLLTGDALAAP